MKSTISFIKIEPEEGKYLTQKDILGEEERVFSTLIYCPQGQEEFWEEVDEEFKKVWEESLPKKEEQSEGDENTEDVEPEEILK